MIDALSEISLGPSLDVSSAFVDAFGIAALEEAASAGAVRLLVGCDLNEMPTAQDIITFENAHIWKDTGSEPIERALDDNSITPAVRTLRMATVETKKASARNHSKLYVDQNTGIVGSSNLTRAGMLGQRELSLLQRRSDAVSRLRQWYDTQWTKAADAEREPFKDRLIDWLENARVELYAPFHPYAKALFERFRHRFLALAPSAGDVDLAIFQQEGRDAALSILAEHRCCIIADAVGMGKTFVALGAVQRRAQTRPRNQRRVLVICPAQLEGVWEQAGVDQGVALHTESMETLGQTTATETAAEERLRSLAKYAIVIVDEAHNFRNPLANRFANLMRVLSDGPEDKEVLLLTATPINNGIGDLYSLYRLMTRDNDAFFQTTNLRMRSLKEFFKDVEKNSASTTDLLLETMVCRSRLDIRHRQDAGEVIVIGGKDVRFPNRRMTALNYSLSTSTTDLTYLAIGAAIEQLTLGAYNVEQYARRRDAQADQTYQRLQALFKILLLKRLESSITAFVSTGERLLKFSDAVVTALRQGRKLTNEDFRKLQQDFTTTLFGDDDDGGEQSSAYLQALAEKDPANYDVARLGADVASDHALLEPLLKHARAIRGISDGKIARLKQVLASKLPAEKVLLFTFYSDTAAYIREQLTGDPAFMASIRNARIEAITGKMRPADKSRIVREFAPIANGKKDDLPKNPIQLLISTDVLAEGQNLQDCGYLINYDLHFNPVRMIQRNGRIDRLFSEHEEITIANFFPEEDLDAQLKIVTNLQTKIARIQENMPTDSSVIGEAVRVFSLDELRRTRAGDASVIDDIDARNPIDVFQNTLSVAFKLLLDFGIEQVEKIPFGWQSNKRSTRTGLFLCVRAKSDAYPNTCWWLLYPDVLNSAAEPMREVSEILPLIETPKPATGLPNLPDVLPRDIHWPAILDAEKRCRGMLVEQRRSAARTGELSAAKEGRSLDGTGRG
jgi:superfamily II DNA or RNA helicase